MNETNQPDQTAENPQRPPKITREDIEKGKASKRYIIFSYVQALFAILLSSFLVSFSSYCLIAPNEFTIGGVSGIAILVEKATNKFITQDTIVICLNLPLIILAFFHTKKRFALLSACNILMQYIWLLAFKNFLPDFKIIFEDNGEKIFAALAGGLCIGAAIALAFKSGGSTGGTDIMAAMIQKKLTASSIARLLFIINCIVISCSIFVYQGATLAQTILPIMMATFEAYIETITNESLMNGLHSAIEFRIITSKPEEISVALMQTLQRGVTSLPATGMYTGESRSMICCVVHRRQVPIVKKLIYAIDPHSFAIVSTVSQVMGLGFVADEINN